MYRGNSNIIGYLHQKAFFTRSPTPSPNKHQNSRFSTNQTVTPPKLNRNKAQAQPQYTVESSQRYNTGKEVGNRSIFDLPKSNNNNRPKQKKSTNQSIVSKISLKQQKQRQTPKSSLSTVRQTLRQQPQKSKYFQSSRLQVKMCLQQLSSRVTNQLRKIQSAIVQLTVALQSDFHSRMKNLRQQMIKVIDGMFVEAQKDLDGMIGRSTQMFLRKMVKAKQRLSQTGRQLGEMKGVMEDNWRKIAGDIMGSSFDQKIQQYLKDSQELRMGVGTFKNGGDKIQQQAIWKQFSTSIKSLIKNRSG